MNKDALAKVVGEKVDTTKKEALVYVDAVFEVITETLAEGGEINLHGFGKFSVSERAARTAKNPQNGEEVQVPAKTVPKFKALKGLKDAVSGN